MTLHHALEYSARGWPVFPLHTPATFGPKVGTDRARCSCGKPGCQNQGKHPRTPHGLDDATTEPDQVTAWWTAWPDANIGIRTGVAFDVLDLDGIAALDALDEVAPTDAGPIAGPTVVTGLGVHIYVATTGHGNRAAMGGRPGLDWRGTGGYVVAPPSLHYLHGDRYAWSDGFGPDTDLEAAPRWLLNLVTRRHPVAAPRPGAEPPHQDNRYGARALEAELGRLALAGEGSRNHELNRAAYNLGQLVAGRELDAHTVASGLLTVAMRIGLTEDEAVATITSGMRSGMESPRTRPVDR